MGADGGVNWVKLVGNHDEFYRLVEPFGILWESDDFYDTYHNDWLSLEEASFLSEDIYLISRYGTNFDIQGFDTLKQIIEEIPYNKLKKYTFREILLDIATEPKWKYEQRNGWDEYKDKCPIRHMVSKSSLFPFGFDINIYDEYEHPLLDMVLEDWVERICECIDPYSFGRQETWT